MIYSRFPFFCGLIILGSVFPAVRAVEFIDHGQLSYQTFTSEGGFFKCDFLDDGTGMPGTVKTDGTYDLRVSAFSAGQIEGIMKAVNTLEKTFVFATNESGSPVRPAQLTFAMSSYMTNTSAAADPITAIAHKGYLPPRTTWLESDFDGRATGKKAMTTNLESLLKYGVDAFSTGLVAANPEYEQQSIIGKQDGYILFNVDHFNEDGSAGTGMPPIETVALHELGHLLSFNSNVDSAMSMLVEKGEDGLSYFVGETAMAYNNGERVQMSEAGIDHINAKYGREPGALMSQYILSNRTEYSDLDLAFFQDMGWTIQDSAWTNPLIPEPSTFLPVFGVFVFVVCRRKRRK